MLKTSIQTRLIAAFLVILILPCSVVGWFSYLEARQQVEDQIMQSASQSVQSANHEINTLISKSLSDMDYLAQKINGQMVDGTASPQVRAILEPYKAINPQYEVVYFGTNTGVMIFSPDRTIEGYDPKTRPWFIKATENKGKAIISDPFLSATNNQIAVNPSKTSDDGSGVVGGSLVLTELAKRVNSIKVGQNGYVFILDKDRKYVTNPTIEPGTENTEPYITEFYESDAGTVDFQFNGVDTKGVFVTNELTGWKIIGAIEMSEVANATKGILYTTIAVIAIAIIIGVMLALWIVRSITTPLKQLIHTTEKIAAGNLTEEIAIHSKDELGQLSASVNHMVHNLRDLIGGVVSSSHNVASASEQISATTQEIAGRISVQSQSAQNMQELFSELSVAINSAAENAEEAAELATQTTSIAHDGGSIVKNSISSMNQVNLQMTRLEEDSNKIGEIIEVIDDISDQTNLLALNAAIEAARAGEQGRGFAVVADEVRKLAERSGEATKQITAIIKGMQENTHRSVMAVSDGVSQSEETGKAFDRIIEMISKTELKVGEIAAACEEQAAQSNEVMHSIENISAASQEAAAASEETAATSQSLAQLAEGLNESVSVFKIK